MIAIINYGAGNLFSLSCSLRALGTSPVITDDAEIIHKADKLILPGVGAFGDAIDALRSRGLDSVIRRETAAGKPLFGICLGMQLLFTRSYEFGVHDGLDLIPGEVRPLEGRIPSEYKIPQIGWNSLHIVKPDSPMMKNCREGEHVYFVHSYAACDCDGSTVATTEYGATVTAAAEYKNVMGCQFHPEKSGSVGMLILRAFCEL